MFWLQNALKERLPHFVPPIDTIFDDFMLDNTYRNYVIPDNKESTFKMHDEEKFEQYINSINEKLGEKVYATYPELNHLGIILNVEIGYLIHVRSIIKSEENFAFVLNGVSTNVILKSIIDACDFGYSKPSELSLINLWIRNLYEESNIKLQCTRKKYRFDIDFKHSFDDILSIGNKKLGLLNVYCKADPLLPIYNSFQCDLCLRSYLKRDSVIRHINSIHGQDIKIITKFYISESSSQLFTRGMMSVLMSENYIKRNKLKSEILESSSKNYKQYKVSKISSHDEMFKSNYIVKFINKLEIKDYDYYLNHSKIVSNFIKMQIFLTDSLTDLITIYSKAYKYNENFTFHKSKVMKLYLSETSNHSFNFVKLSNNNKIRLYAENISKAIIILLMAYNVEHKLILSFCESPNYKPLFNSSQKFIIEKLLLLIMRKCKIETFLFKFNITSNTENDDLLKLWDLISNLFINISTQETSEFTPLQTIFTFSICNFDKSSKTLTFFKPSRRKVIFQSLLYIIRLSFLSKLTNKNDENFTLKLGQATKTGELRKIIEKMYYPTLYYFLRKKSYIMKPFFNPEKYTYVHPVLLKDKFIGCKILGLFSLNIMIERIESFLNSEILYVKSLAGLNIENEIVKKEFQKFQSKYKRQLEDDEFNGNNNIDENENIKRSIACITCLLIGYLALTSTPLPQFGEYLNLDINCFKFMNDALYIEIESENICIKEESMIKYFTKYLTLRKYMMNKEPNLDKSKFFMDISYVKSQTFLDLMSCKYTDYKYLYVFLKEAQTKCRNETGNEGNNRPNWLSLIKNQMREKSEGFLVINLKLIAPEYQQFVINKQENVIPDQRSYISCDDEINLNQLIENGFFDTRIDDDEKDDVDVDVECDITFDFTEYSEADFNMIDNDYSEMMKYIKSKNSNFANKRMKI